MRHEVGFGLESIPELRRAEGRNPKYFDGKRIGGGVPNIGDLNRCGKPRERVFESRPRNHNDCPLFRVERCIAVGFYAQVIPLAVD